MTRESRGLLCYFSEGFDEFRSFFDYNLGEELEIVIMKMMFSIGKPQSSSRSHTF